MTARVCLLYDEILIFCFYFHILCLLFGIWHSSYNLNIMMLSHTKPQTVKAMDYHFMELCYDTAIPKVV